MAKILTEEILKALKKFDLPKGYQRTGEFPLDPSSVFASKADADLYAAGEADSRGLSGTRYAGQLIAVVENGVTTLYTVESNDTLKAVGGDVSADLATLTSKVDAILAGNHEGLDSYDSAAVRLLTNGNSRAEADKKFEIKISAGTKQVVIAVPAARSLKSVINVGLSRGEVADTFVASTVDVEGENGYTAAPYKVYVFNSSTALDANTYEVTLA